MIRPRTSSLAILAVLALTVSSSAYTWVYGNGYVQMNGSNTQHLCDVSPDDAVVACVLINTDAPFLLTPAMIQDDIHTGMDLASGPFDSQGHAATLDRVLGLYCAHAPEVDYMGAPEFAPLPETGVLVGPGQNIKAFYCVFDPDPAVFTPSPFGGNEGPHFIQNENAPSGYQWNAYQRVPMGGDVDFQQAYNWGFFSPPPAPLDLCDPFHEGVVAGTADLAANFTLSQNHPNPFNPTTVIEFSLVGTTAARLSVHNLAGQEVAVLVDGLVSGGAHRVEFDAGALPSGVYFSTLAADGRRETRKMVLAR